jgi:hypothetical protein
MKGGEMIFAFYPAAAVLCALLHLAFTRRERTAEFVWAVILTYAIVFNIGAAGLMGFYAHAFRAAETAALIGWQPGSPFQYEVACANLAFGVLGILCAWLRSTFRLATIIGYSVFLVGAAYGHIQQMAIAQNYSPGNAGGALYADIIVPPVLLSLWIIHYVIAKRGRPSAQPAEQAGC